MVSTSFRLMHFALSQAVVMHGRSAHPCLQVGHANRGKPMSQVSCTPAIADSCDAGSGRCVGQPGMRQSISPRPRVVGATVSRSIGSQLRVDELQPLWLLLGL